MELVCNGRYDCEDKTDESHFLNCSYPLCNTTTHFQCDNGFCISQDQLCDDVIDCPGSEDESPAICGKLKNCLKTLFTVTQGCTIAVCLAACICIIIIMYRFQLYSGPIQVS